MSKILFAKKKYVVQKKLETILDEFNKGEEVVFEKSSYSHYDNATIYTFSKKDKYNYKQAFIADDSKIEISEYFQLK